MALDRGRLDLTARGTGKCKIKVLADWVPDETPLSVLWMATFSLKSSQWRKREREREGEGEGEGQGEGKH